MIEGIDADHLIFSILVSKCEKLWESDCFLF